jgi:hypothetical protein
MPAVVTESWKGVQWDLSQTGRTAARYFDVSGATSAKDAEQAVKDSTGLDINQPYGTDSSALLCSAIRLIEQLGPYYHRFGAIFGIPPNGKWVIQNSDDAISLTPQVEFSRSIKSVPVDKDRLGIPYINSAGDPFSPNSESPRTTRYMSVERYDVYENSVNSDVLTLGPLTFQPNQVLCHCIEPVGKFPLDSSKLLIRYEFEFDRSNPHPFQNRLIDKGRNGWYSGSGGSKRGQICYSNGDPVSDDVLLDSTGKPVDTTLKVLNSAGDPASPVVNPSIPGYYATEHSSGDIGYVLVFKERTTQPFLALGL